MESQTELFAIVGYRYASQAPHNRFWNWIDHN